MTDLVFNAALSLAVAMCVTFMGAPLWAGPFVAVMVFLALDLADYLRALLRLLEGEE